MGLIGRLRNYLRGRRVGRVPRYRIADLPDNTLGRVSGVVEALDGPLLEAPLSGRRCVYYAIVIDDYVAGAYGALELARSQHAIPFSLRDGDQRAVIDPGIALISAGFDHVTESRPRFDTDPRHRALLEHHDLAWRDWVETTSLRYCEAVIEVGETISIIGSGVREADPSTGGDRGYRDGGATRLRMSGSVSAPLLISDHPKSL